MKKNTKPLVITLITIAAAAAVAAGVWFLWLKDYVAAAGGTPVYVNTVSSIIGLDTGTSPRYTGIVEPQETFQIKKDETKVVSEVLVKEGDEVHVGDVLFRYSTEDLQLSLTQAEIDLEGINAQINELNRQVTTLQEQQKTASSDDQYSYTVRIQGVQLDIRRQQSESSKKQAEIDQLRESLQNAEVFSEVEGIVKAVNDGSQVDYSGGQNTGFLSIVSDRSYRVKGTVSELNVASLSVGQAVTVYSRLDNSVTWAGTVASIDSEAAGNQNQNGYYYYGMDSGERSSKYNFYVDLENIDGLILGQHVYIEPASSSGKAKEGMWLPAMYVGHDDEGSFVWAKDDRDRLEKRLIILGDYDSEDDTYEIKDGVSRMDSIAYPSEELRPGLPTTTDATYTPGLTADEPYDEGWMDGMDVLPDKVDDAYLPDEDMYQDYIDSDPGVYAPEFEGKVTLDDGTEGLSTDEEEGAVG